MLAVFTVCSTLLLLPRREVRVAAVAGRDRVRAARQCVVVVENVAVAPLTTCTCVTLTSSRSSQPGSFWNSNRTVVLVVLRAACTVKEYCW